MFTALNNIVYGNAYIVISFYYVNRTILNTYGTLHSCARLMSNGKHAAVGEKNMKENEHEHVCMRERKRGEIGYDDPARGRINILRVIT